MTLLTRIGRTAKKHPVAFCCRVLLCIPLTLLLTLLEMAALMVAALRQEIRKLFPYEES